MSNSLDRQKIFSNWNTTYRAGNENMLNTKSEREFKTDTIKDWFKNNYHDYKRGSYETESMKTIGIYGNNPNEKFSVDVNFKPEFKNKVYSDGHDLNLGTTKTSSFIPGYSGYIPVNSKPLKNTSVNDAHLGVGKANHVLTYNTRLPGYQGYIPTNSQNIKGVIRPSCLSTKEEAFH